VHDLQERDPGQDSTNIEYCPPTRYPEGNSGAASGEDIADSQSVWSPRDALLFQCTTNQRTRSCSGKKTKGVKRREVEPQHAVEKENRFLKARVEELEAENVKVGHVISDLRSELETAGVLQRLRQCPTNAESRDVEQGKEKINATEGTSLPR
jgi:hypothetical protein